MKLTMQHSLLQKWTEGTTTEIYIDKIFCIWRIVEKFRRHWRADLSRYNKY